MKYYDYLRLGKKVKNIDSSFNVSTSPINKTIGNTLCTVHVLEGKVWVKPDGVADSNTGSIEVTGAIEFVCDSVSVVSDSTGAKVQIITWG